VEEQMSDEASSSSPDSALERRLAEEELLPTPAPEVISEPPVEPDPTRPAREDEPGEDESAEQIDLDPDNTD
jgi:hypothetical protein